MTAILTGCGAETAVSVQTELNLTGRPAQFGRGLLADVSSNIVDQFAANLAEEVRRDDSEQPRTAATESEIKPTVRSDATPARSDTIDILRVARGPLAIRIGSALGLLAALVVAWRHRR
jgi:hypothetical protein